MPTLLRLIRSRTVSVALLGESPLFFPLCAVSRGHCSNEFFHPVQSGVELVDIPFRGNVVVVHEKLDHGIKAYRLSFSFCHPFLQGTLKMGTFID
jgi:hypothetical protein